MNNVYAFIVGIEKYDEPECDTPGPCANALAVADWCLSKNIPPENIFLFLEPRADTKLSAVDLPTRFPQVRFDATYATINKFRRETLPDCATARSRLLVYWSGHGYTDTDLSRILLCRDYTSARLNDCVFNFSNFISHLRGTAFQRFPEQLIALDACGSYTALKFTTERTPPDRLNPSVQQTTYFAVPDGKRAEIQGLGVFTKLLVSVLDGFDGWPDSREFVASMEKQFKGVGQTPFRIAYRDDATGTEEVGRRVGTTAIANESALFASVHQLLSPLKLADPAFNKHYVPTCLALRAPKMLEAQGLNGMLHELTSLRDEIPPDQVPYGLLQFLVRLREEPEACQVIDEWLNNNAGAQGNDRANIDELLRREIEEKILVVEVSVNEKQRIAEFQPYLRTLSRRPVPDDRLKPESVTDWEDFVAKFLELIERLKTPPRVADFEIHFVIDSPLYDRPFHEISMVDGKLLGERYVVLLRDRERNRKQSVSDIQEWIDHAKMLSTSIPKDIQLVPVKLVGARGRLPSEKGIHCAHFVLSPTGDSSNLDAKNIIWRLASAGVPYIFWLHRDPEVDHAGTATCFADWLEHIASLNKLPPFLKQQRILNTDASQASFLWDDPQTKPF